LCQIQDDILDIESDTQTLGKPQGSNVARNKATLPAIIGIDSAKAKTKQLFDDAYAALDPFGTQANQLRTLTQWLYDRRY